jgi:hypothetical protein
VRLCAHCGGEYLWLPGHTLGSYCSAGHKQAAWRADKIARVRDLAAFLTEPRAVAALRTRMDAAVIAGVKEPTLG